MVGLLFAEIQSSRFPVWSSVRSQQLRIWDEDLHSSTAPLRPSTYTTILRDDSPGAVFPRCEVVRRLRRRRATDGQRTSENGSLKTGSTTRRDVGVPVGSLDLLTSCCSSQVLGSRDPASFRHAVLDLTRSGGRRPRGGELLAAARRLWIKGVLRLQQQAARRTPPCLTT